MNSIVEAYHPARRILVYLPLGAVLLFCLIYALAFTSIYSSEHAYQASSRWMYANLPHRARISGVHWDDWLPLALPGHPSDYFRNQGELPLYEADTPVKVQIIAEKLSRTDFFILPTQRLQGAIPRRPLEFPYTTNFFRLLFAEQLGFRLIKTFKVHPAFLFFQFDDQLADESFSVYDHPKVSIFKNEQKLTAAALRTAIMSPPQAGSPTLTDIMLKEAP